MKVGDMVRVGNGTGYFEDGEETSCMWPESAGQTGVIVELAVRQSRMLTNADPVSHQKTVKILVMGELAEFKCLAVKLV